MKAYLLAVSGAILISAVLACILPDGKMGKFIRGMSRLFVFSVLLLPLLNLFSGKGFVFSAANIEEDGSYLTYCAETLAKEDEEEIANLILEEFPLEIGIDVVRSAEPGFPRKKISVKIYDSGLLGEEEHIHILSCIEELLEGYGCRTEVIWQEEE